MSKASKVIGVDVGGTFTDAFVLDEQTNSVRVAKVPSTRGDQSKGFIEGISKANERFDDISTVIHGTTVGTNALLERKGAQTGIITTKGFRDVLEMRRRDRPNTWGLWGMFEPVVPRNLRLEVSERTLADGTIRTPVDIEEVKSAAQQLLDARCEAVCIFFINGYANGANERAAAEAVRYIWPTPYVAAATEILPEIREFERCSTGTLNAYLQPVVASYLDRLEGALGERSCPGEILIVQSNGGVMSIEMAKELPVRTALSGPAAGVIAGQHIARAAGLENVITCDMGGTSFDVSLIANGVSALAAQTQIDFGMVVRTPMIEITTIGAGGGSIARIDEGGLLEVGPESAGSDPGPVAYGLGNDRPTVTDANLVLGRINPDRPIGGKLKRLDVEAAKQAIEKHIAKPLDLNPMDGAEAIVRVANAKMTGAIRLISIERGHDPKKFSAMPFGGGGALHTGALMNDIGLASAIVPRYPGVTSALGCVVADMRHDIVKTVNKMLDDVDADELGSQMTALADRAQAALSHSGATIKFIEKVYELDMLYLGQTHTVAVPVEMNSDTLTKADILNAFQSAYKETFGRLLEKIPARIVNMRIAVIGKRPEIDLSSLMPETENSVDDCHLGTRQVYESGTWVEVNRYQRLDLPVGAVLKGPALAEQPDTTIFIDSGLEGRVDEFGNMIITRAEAP
ncbi:MAG: hydantoinase/oxoprolinase family protein [Hyphomicrobiales bacterium]